MAFMKAIVFQQYGSPDFLELKEAEQPTPGDNEVLIKVHAAAINEWDWAVLHGVPFVNRLGTGLFRPKKQILGADVAGIVESVGRNVMRFQPGDEVFGDICLSGNERMPGYRGGCFAEYVCAPEQALQTKPTSLSFTQAASLPQAGALAVQGFLQCGLPSISQKQGQKVLINGAGGGAGSFAIQIAKAYGAEVTAVDSSAKLEKVQSLGADHVIDFTQEDFTRNGLCYDLILDVMGFHSIFDNKRTLCPKGCYVMLGGGSRYTAQVMLLGRLISLTGNKRMGILLYKPNKGLDLLVELIEEGKVTPLIDKTFRLSETADAFRYYGEGHFCGKIVITTNQ
jgi:NADPH:quinone reductase-like Zn-dependent oxidoreductase